ncbi:MAG: ATP-dependent Clp protease proteolytic subunit [Prevotellaceae bacterium]|jgi:ATP-dependent protease ClpP protease subunit|nr:ATP-dependent Clp protease proteolytic subunit [Prevotellaceae bacterium]
MNEIPFIIAAEKTGAKTGRIRITGYIGWDTDSEGFRKNVDSLIASGVEKVQLYINSPGGSVFDANEIVNIISQFKDITGEGGALVASAATYIALCCKSFTMPANGQFMIHKPKTAVSGTVAELEAAIEGLKNIESDYFERYKAKAKNTKTLDEKWNKGDWWMTAETAKEQGFITGVKEKIRIDSQTAAMIAAYGQKFNNNNSKMELKFIATSLGLAEDASLEQIVAKIGEINALAVQVSTLQQQIKEIETGQISAAVDAAISAKKITADKKQHFIDMGGKIGIEALNITFAAMSAAVKPSDIISQNGNGGEKKWSELTADERVALRANDAQKYRALYKAEYGVEAEVSG